MNGKSRQRKLNNGSNRKKNKNPMLSMIFVLESNTLNKLSADTSRLSLLEEVIDTRELVTQQKA